MSPLAFALLLASLGGGPGARPVECNVLPGERGANVWERAKVPELRRYCDLVAGATAKLVPGSRLVASALRLAEEADALVPGRVAPLLLEGRALAQLGRYRDAVVALDAARARDPHALDDLMALFAWALAVGFTGDVPAARQAYHDLLPRADLLPLADRGVAYLGAGMLAMSLGPVNLAESVAILRQARRDSQDLLREASTFVLALALDRSGDRGEAAAVLAEEGAVDASSVMTDPRVLAAMGTTGEKEARAAQALALDLGGKHDAARPLWQSYLAAATGGPWEAYARARAGPVPRRGAGR